LEIEKSQFPNIYEGGGEEREEAEAEEEEAEEEGEDGGAWRLSPWGR
jgi:hypothetical protein